MDLAEPTDATRTIYSLLILRLVFARLTFIRSSALPSAGIENFSKSQVPADGRAELRMEELLASREYQSEEQ